MKKNWWKILGVLLLLYVLTVGMLIPLKPGIVEVIPGSVRTGDQIDLKVLGYNSFYSLAKKPIRAWLKLDDDRALQASDVKVTSDRQLAIRFDIPDYLPINTKVQDFALVLDSDADGPSILPSAVFVTQDSIDPEMGLQVWKNSPIDQLTSKNILTFPFRNILSETIRNTYFHVSLWLSMMIIFIGSVGTSIGYLRTNNLDFDRKAKALTVAGFLFGLLGLTTGAIWANYTWGQPWSNDVKQITTAIALLIYGAYFILRSAFEDEEQKARISAIYNIFAFVTLIPLLYVIPRMTDSLHPGAGGNPAFGSQDLDSTMRMIFYPAVIGWALIGLWMAQLLYRVDRIRAKLLDLH
ncbi:MAG: hypothetical protein DHS20C18_40930 [Saprospiraceae bacterium]|nr:MAG: hypothetical protein DHS20C18_40930 [Saprospiraceae bacterium]